MRKDIAMALALMALLLLGGVAGLIVWDSGGLDEFEVESGSQVLDALDEPESLGVRRHIAVETEHEAMAGGTPLAADGLFQIELSEELDEGSLRGLVRDLEGRVVPGARLLVSQDISPTSLQTIYGDTVDECFSDPKGRYVFGPLPALDDLCLRVYHPNYSDKVIGALGLVPGQSKAVNVTLVEGVTLSGHAQDHSGRALAGVEVTLMDQTRHGFDSFAAGSYERRATTDADGNFVLVHLTPGSKRAWGKKLGYSTQINTKIFLQRGQHAASLEFVFEAGSFIEGRIEDQEGRGVENAVITAVRVRNAKEKRKTYPPQPPTLSGPGGLFRCEGLLAGSYNLGVRAKGFARRGAFAVARTGTADTLVKLRPHPMVVGTVVDDRGAPVKNFSLIASGTPELAHDIASMHQRFHDVTGRFDFQPSQPSGRIYLFAKARGFAGGRSEVIHLVDGRDPAPVEIRLTRGATLKGRIIDSKGQGLRGATIEVLTSARNQQAALRAKLFGHIKTPTRRGRSQDKGLWSVRRLMPGTYTLRIRHGRYAAYESDTPIEVRAGAVDVDLGDLTLEPGATLRGQVAIRVDDRNQKLGTPVVIVMRPLGGASGPVFRVNADRHGAFVIPGIPAGSYRVERVDPGLNLKALRGPRGVEVTLVPGEERELQIR
ncbi:MAG: carboxypeptidase-like regulatory domain-containing protein [Planctomycetota bacterium]